jgi:hypothetical protein
MTTNKAPSSSIQRTFWDRFILPIGRFLVLGDGVLSSSGMGLRIWVRGMVFTALSFGLLNTWLAWNVDRSYANATLLEVNEARSTDEAVQEAIAAIGSKADMAQQEFVREAFRERPASATYRFYLLNIIRAVQGDVSPQVERTLDRHMTGNQHGTRFFALTSEGVSGTAVVEALSRVDSNWNHKTALLEDADSTLRGTEADAFLAKFIDRAAQETRPALRNLMRLNGWIQWCTICVCWVVMLLTAARATLLARLVTTGWFPNVITSRFTRFLAAGASPRSTLSAASSAAAFAAKAPIESFLDRQVYSTYEFLVALLPSLGFVGTVVGMGDALLTADSLFSAADKSRAISTITSHLGFAFDTTLVGLITGIIAGSIVVRLRQWENSLWYEVQSQPANRPPDYHPVLAAERAVWIKPPVQTEV